jgi:biopolymer transport protein ExbD
MAGGGGGEEGEFGLQIAPMLDVMFVLLLFFMVSAGVQVKEAEIGVQVPGEGKPANPGTQQTPVTLKILSDGTVKFNDQVLDPRESKEMPQLRQRMIDLVTAFGEQPVIISPEKDVVHQRLMDVLNICSAAKVKNLSFSGG